MTGSGSQAKFELRDDRLRKRLAELSRFSRSAIIGELSASLSDAINTPLGAICANAEALELMLRSGSPALEELRAIAVDVRQDAQRAADVLRHLQTRRAPLHLENVDLEVPVREAIDFLSTLGQKVKVSSSIAPTPLPVKADVVQLHQAIMSLITNAMEAVLSLPSIKPEVLVSTERVCAYGKISVLDNGPGIQSDKLTDIFAPFASTKNERMGMGLSIARTIISAHHGEIWAENRPTGGAALHIRLPLAT